MVGSDGVAPPQVWGICGGSGSGKTTLTTQIVDRLGPDRVVTINHDAYYFDRPDLSFGERCAVNYDHPASLETDLLIEHLRLLRTGRPAPVPTYDFARHQRGTEVDLVEPRPLVLVEGILVFAVPELRAVFDRRIFVEVSPDIRLARRVRRDVADRGRDPDDVRANWELVVLPMHDKFVRPFKGAADWLVEYHDDRTAWLDLLAEGFRQPVG